jgi:cation diffusion facilitator family transporter
MVRYIRLRQTGSRDNISNCARAVAQYFQNGEARGVRNPRNSFAFNIVACFSLIATMVAAFAISLRQYRTYGFRRSSILAALANAVLLLIAIGGIAWEAIQRIGNSEPVAAGTVILVASVGIVINTATTLLFLSGHKGDLNIRGAFLHMAADAGVSLGVVVGGIAIVATGWT